MYVKNQGLCEVQSMRRHGLDKAANCGNCLGRPKVIWVQDADRMHQLLDSNGRVIDMSCCDEAINDVRRSVLKMVDVDTGVEQQRRAADALRADEWQLRIIAAGQGFARIEPCPTNRGVEVEARHLRSRVSAPGRPCREPP